MKAEKNVSLEKVPYVLVTGGAGYIGSFMVRKLTAQGFAPVTIDNLSNGRKESVLQGEFFQGDIGDAGLVRDLIARFKIKDVLHFAAYASVLESIRNPKAYMENNLEKSRRLFQVCADSGVENIIYSSSSSVYGIPDILPITEEHPLQPISPYGESKKQGEAALQKIASDSPGSQLKYIILRYFNVVGADIEGTLGEWSNKNGRLFKIAAEAATGKRDRMYIYGTDYPTEDGTAIRDYIHVVDLVDVHWHALKHLRDGGHSDIFNVGYGKGWSVKQILHAFQTHGDQQFTIDARGRRQGDPPNLVGDISKLKRQLSWQPKYDNMPNAVKSVLNWEKKIRDIPEFLS